MSGLYLHIPFCKQACHYCNFHFSTSLRQKDDLLRALREELRLRQSALQNKPLETIYFGGGTPSLLEQAELSALMEQLHKYFRVEADAEITLEANPDDITPETLRAWHTLGINRLSIGVQSFFDEDLRFLHRVHDAQQAENAIRQAQEAGFENISIDLIYGIPALSDERWRHNLHQAFVLGVPHLSAYALTVEPKTALAHSIRAKKISPLNEEQSAAQLEFLMEEIKSHGYLHYEISNCCLPGKESRHNTAYWMNKPYLGIGPSAHSFFPDEELNIYIRQWNIAQNAGYVRAILSGKIPAEKEMLTPKQRCNEYVMTSLRTMWGCDLNKAEHDFGAASALYLKKESAVFLEQGMMELRGNKLLLSDRGKLLADRIAAQLFQ